MARGAKSSDVNKETADLGTYKSKMRHLNPNKGIQVKCNIFYSYSNLIMIISFNHHTTTTAKKFKALQDGIGSRNLG